MNVATKDKVVPRTIDLRDRLKQVIEAELNKLPVMLEGLSDKERLNVVLKLMPLVLPRSKPVYHGVNERDVWS